MDIKRANSNAATAIVVVQVNMCSYPLPINVGSMKNFDKVMDNYTPGYIRAEVSRKLVKQKLKKESLGGPHIRSLMAC